MSEPRDERERALFDALAEAVEWVETAQQCDCVLCSERIYRWKSAMGPFLPTADDVYGILTRAARSNNEGSRDG